MEKTAQAEACATKCKYSAVYVLHCPQAAEVLEIVGQAY
jgi:hypothetical protein